MRSANSLRSATNVNLPLGQSRYRGNLQDNNSDRFYRLRLNQRSTLNLSLSGLQANADLALVNEQGKTISRSAQSGHSNESIAQAVEPGTYYVRVFRKAGKTHYQLKIGATATTDASLSTQPNPTLSLADQVLALVNNQRQQAGLKPVRLNSSLSAAAQSHSEDMALNDFFGHGGSSGSKVDDRVLAAGYNYALVGENIAAGFSTPESVVQAWMESPSHRQNILHPLLKEMGIGFYFLENDAGTANYRYYWTQDFGSPIG